MKKDIYTMNFAELSAYLKEIEERREELEKENIIIGIDDDVDGHFSPYIYKDDTIQDELNKLYTESVWIFNNMWKVKAKEEREIKEALNPALKVKREKKAVNQKIKRRENNINNLSIKVNNLEVNFDKMIEEYTKELKATIEEYKAEIVKNKKEIAELKKLL